VCRIARAQQSKNDAKKPEPHEKVQSVGAVHAYRESDFVKK